MFRFSGSVVLALVMLAGACASDDVGAPASAPGSGGKVDDLNVHGENHGVVLKSLWQEQSDTEGKQGIAIFGDDLYTDGEHFLVYGEKDGTMRSRSFAGGFMILDIAGHTEKRSDSFYELTANFVTKDRMEVTMVGRDGRRYDLVYDRLDSNLELTDQAADVIDVLDSFYAKYDALMETEVETLGDLKNFIELHRRSHSYAPQEDKALAWQFKDEPLQIEAKFAMTAANQDLADSEVVADGSDAASQYFAEKFGQGWTSDADLPDPEEVLDGFDYESDPPTFYQFQSGIEGVSPGQILDGLQMFASQTVFAMHPFECEGGYDWVRDFHWVLQDGSIFSYMPYPECD